MFWIFLIIAIIVVVVIFKKNSGRSSNTYTTSTASGYADTPKPRQPGKLYAAVYPYGFWSVCTYTCDASFNEGDLVVVDIKGKQYPGRILNVSDKWPEDVPKNVTLKPVIRRLKASDKGTLAFWSEKIDEFFS